MKRNNRILFLLHIPPPIHGSSVVGEFIKNSKIINKRFESYYVNILASSSIKNTGKTSVLKILLSLKNIFSIFKILLFHRPNVCYFAITLKGFAFYRDALIVLLIKIFNVKIVYHLHHKAVKHYCYNYLYHFVFRRSKVILLSKVLHNELKEFIDISNVIVLPNGIPDSIDNNFRPKHSLIPIVLFLSNLIKHKGVYDLLAAFKILKEKNIAFKGVFVGAEGDITKSAFFSKLKELHLENNVEYLGVKFGLEKEAIFKEADIFAFPSYYETFGLVNLEAMKFHLPVVSTLEGGIPDIVQHNITGFLTHPRDIYNLAEKLELLLLDSELRSKMGAEGRRRFIQNFSLEKFELKLCEILEMELQG